MNGWKNWILGALFTILMGVSSLLYANNNYRLNTLEEANRKADQDRTAIMTDIAVLKVNMLQIREDIQDIKSSNKDTNNKINSLMETVNKNSELWYQAIKRYESSLKK